MSRFQDLSVGTMRATSVDADTLRFGGDCHNGTPGTAMSSLPAILNQYTSLAIKDQNLNEIIAFNPTTSAHNHVQFTNATSNNEPTIAAVGDDTDIDLQLQGKGAGTPIMLDGNSNELMDFSTTASAVNHIQVTNADTGNGPTAAAAGGDTNIDLNLSGKGSGAVKMTSPKILTGIVDTNGNETVAFSAATSAHNHLQLSSVTSGNSPALSAVGDDTNIDVNITGKGTGALKTTSPKISTSILDANGNETIGLSAATSAHNHVQLSSVTSGNSPAISAVGDDTNIDLNLAGKGTGTPIMLDGNNNELLDFSSTTSAHNHVQMSNVTSGNSPAISAVGDDTNIDLNLAGKGSGAARMTSPKVITSIVDDNSNEIISLSSTTSAHNNVQLSNVTSGNSPVVSAVGDDTNIDLNLSGKGSGAARMTSPKIITSIVDDNSNEILGLSSTTSAHNHVQLSNVTSGNHPVISAVGDDTDIDLKLKGKGAGTPQIIDGNDNELLDFSTTTSAHNHFQFANATSVNSPSMTAVGDAANVGADIVTKGIGTGALVGVDTDVVTWQKDTVGKLGFYGGTLTSIQGAVADTTTAHSLSATTSLSAATSDINAALNLLAVSINAIKSRMRGLNLFTS